MSLMQKNSSRTDTSPGRARIKNALLWIAIVIALPFLLQCRNDKEKLAEFKGGAVERGELRILMKLFHPRNTEKAATVKRQDQLLNIIAIGKIAASEARKVGLHKEEEYSKMLPFVNAQVDFIAFRAYMMTMKDKDRKYRFVEMQHLLLRAAPMKALPKGKKQPVAPPRESRLAEAQDLLKRLNDSSLSDKDRNKLISAKTEALSYKPSSGYEIPVCANCRSNQHKFLTDALEKAPEGKFILIPNKRNFYWIARKIREVTLKENDLEEYIKEYFKRRAPDAAAYLKGIKDPRKRKALASRFPLTDKQIEGKGAQYAQRMIAQEKNASLPRFMDKLRKEKKFEFHNMNRMRIPGQKPPEYKADTPLYSINGKVFTYGDLNKKFPVDKFKLPLQLNIARLLGQLELLRGTPEFQASSKTEYYTFLKNYFSYKSLESYYFKKKAPKITISRKDIEREYKVGKLTRFRGRPLKAVEKNIERFLSQQRRRGVLQKARADLIKKYELKIHRKKLKPNKF